MIRSPCFYFFRPRFRLLSFSLGSNCFIFCQAVWIYLIGILMTIYERTRPKAQWVSFFICIFIRMIWKSFHWCHMKQKIIYNFSNKILFHVCFFSGKKFPECFYGEQLTVWRPSVMESLDKWWKCFESMINYQP